MQKDNRGLTVAARRRQRETGETYMQALAAVKPPRLNRDEADATSAMATMGFAQLMAAGAKARAFPAVYPGGAGAVVREAVTALWPRVTPGAVTDVLVACAGVVAARREDDPLDGWGECPVAEALLEMSAAHPVPALPGSPPYALAAGLAFDRDEDEAVLHGTWVLLALAHERGHEPGFGLGDPGDDDWGDDDRGACGECGGELRGKGTYGCECWDPAACSECGDNSGRCDCWE